MTALKSYTDPGLCLECSRTSRTCCQTFSGSEHFFPLSNAEIVRITGSGVQPKSFRVQVPNLPVFIRSVKNLLPEYREQVHRVFRPDENHFRLKTTSDGDCVFLDKSGCSLARRIRPAYCKLFPLWICSGKLAVLEDNACLAQKSAGGDVRKLMAFMQTSASEILTLYSHMLKDLGFDLLPG